MAVTKYLDKTGLTYFWGKIKAWANAAFAAISHTHTSSDVTAMTSYSKPNSGSTISTNDTLNEAIGKLEAKVDAVDQSSVVHRTGAETIDGIKTFNDVIMVDGHDGIRSQANIFNDTDSVSENTYQYIIGAWDANNNSMADIYYGRSSNDTTVLALRVRNKDRTKAGYLQLNYWASSDVFTVIAPTPPSISNGSDVSTTAWVRTFCGNTYLPLTGGTLTGGLNIRLDMTRGTAPSTWKENGYYMVDSAGNRTLALTSAYGTDKSSRNALYAYNTTVASGGNIGYIGIGCTSSGSIYTHAPTPASSDSSTQIATTNWVAGADCVVHKTDNETISGTKTFNNRINGIINYKMTAAKKNSNPSSNAYVTTVQVSDNDNDAISELFFGRETGGGSVTVIRTWSKSRQNTVSWNTYMPETGRGYCFGNLFKDMTLVNNNYTRGTTPSATQWWSLSCQGSTSDDVGGIWHYVNSSNESQTEIRCTQGKASSPVTKTFWICILNDGTSVSGTNASLFRPSRGIYTKLGDSGDCRWGQIYSTQGSISTSDIRQKQNIGKIPDEVLDVWESCEFYQYRMIKSVKEKGNNARYHTGMVAQYIKSLFDNKNQDISKYGLFCYDEWDSVEAKYDENGNESEAGSEAGNEYSLRYEELLCMEAAYQRRKNKILENRISELEKQVSDMLILLQNLTNGNG